MDNYGTVDNPAWISTVFCALMHLRVRYAKEAIGVGRGHTFWSQRQEAPRAQYRADGKDREVAP